ncbi:DUF3040 domain-containing protein [Demequina sp. TTPB684]|uniref:DUF3040 domain-containing protein n=1 Tax=unclassified Demequina TaxID=2620311 RepID=UPI001CF38E5A|nr:MULTISPECIES: DUF3040 domain-containing protein [unclassified Demequina]MCB2413752.1 DUF3040 domain-containing protein [Demequina sp. TTPB684]UPU89577.1 DUF3040 domain-containing protein [Demequina sp. TMPB413]
MMPLSEYEQRVLDQLERDLGADPKLGRTMARAPHQRGRIVAGALGVIAGLGVVLVGAVAQIVPVGIAGFALMIAAAMWAIFTPRRQPASAKPRGVAGQAGKKRAAKEPFMRRVEERLARRRESGDL